MKKHKKYSLQGFEPVNFSAKIDVTSIYDRETGEFIYQKEKPIKVVVKKVRRNGRKR